MLDLKGLNRAQALAALYNASKPRVMGILHYNPKPMTEEEAKELLGEKGCYFDYLAGRVMKLNFQADNPSIEEWLYDRDNGPGAAQRAIDNAVIALGISQPSL